MKLALLSALLLAACHPTPPVPTSPDASDASAFGDAPLDDCQRGCAALMNAGCTLGDGGPDCAAFLRAINAGKEPNPQTRKPLTCADVAAVKTKDDARKLGFVCP